MHRRGLLALAVPAASARIARAQGALWPSRPVRLLVPFIPGSAPDVFARQLSERLTPAIGQPMVVENRAGAGGNIGFEAAARSAPDGYTLLFGTNSLVINPALTSRRLGFDPFRDFAPVNVTFGLPHLLIVPANGPKDASALIVSLREGDANYASGGNGSGAHLAAELFKARAGVRATHIPFRGAPDIVNAVVAGQVAFGFPTLSTATELVRAGRVRALAVTSPAPNHALPDVPPLARTLPGFDLVSWFAVLAPSGTPGTVVTRVDTAIGDALADESFRARVTADGSNVIGIGPAAAPAFLRREAEVWGEAVRISGAKVD